MQLKKILLFCSFLIKNYLVVFVPSTTVKCISCCNHSNRKVVGGKHNVLVHYVDVSVPNPSGVVVLCTPFKWDVLCSFLIKKHMAQNSYIAIKALMHHQYYGLNTPKKRYGAHHNTPTRYRAALKINYWMENYLLLTWLPMGRKIIGQNSIHHTTSLFNSFSSYKEYFTSFEA